MRHHRVSVPLVLHRLPVQRRVALVRGPQLVVPDGFLVGDLGPFGGADVVLRVHEGVADEADVGHYAHELFGRHRGPDVPVYLGVVDLFVSKGVLVIWVVSALFLCVYGEKGEMGVGKGGRRTRRVGASIARSLIQSLSS